MSQSVDISVIIVSYNVRDFLLKCIGSVLAHSGELDIEILVVDNASVDGSVEAVKAHFPQVKLIANKENTGFGKANNQAIEIAQGKYTLILNPDTLLADDALTACWDYLEAHEDAGAVGLKMLDGSGKYLPESRRGLPTLWRSFTKISGLYRLSPSSKLWNGYYLASLKGEESGEIEVLTGAFLFTRTALLKQLKGFDEQFFMYGEDIDLSKRILDSGFKIHYLAQPSIIHFKGESTRKADFSYSQRFYQAMVLYTRKHLKKQAPIFTAMMPAFVLVLGFLSWLRNQVAGLIKPLLTWLVCGLVYVLAHFAWARFYFADDHYFNQQNTMITSIIGSGLIAFMAWFFGCFERSSKMKYLHAAMITALLIQLVCFSLLPAHLRNSRAVLLIGWFFCYIVLYVWMTVQRNWSQDRKRRILLVAGQENKAALEALIEHIPQASYLGLVAPLNSPKSNEYLNDVSHLSQLIQRLKANEVIFDAGSMKMQDIFAHMAFPEYQVSYKIASPGANSIVGSSSSRSQGEIYSVEAGYRLSRPVHRRIKRAMDIFTSLIFLPLSLLGLSKKTRKGEWLSVLLGKKTLVTYSHGASSYRLPPMKTGLFYTRDLIGYVFDGNFVDSEENADICYSKNYRPGFDFLVVFKNR